MTNFQNWTRKKSDTSMNATKANDPSISAKKPGIPLPEISETGCKQPEEGLSETEKIYRLMAHYANDAIVLVKDGQTIYRNPAYEKLVGYTAAATCGGNFFNPIAPEDRKRVKCYYKNHLYTLLRRNTNVSGKMCTLVLRKPVSAKSKPGWFAKMVRY